MGEAVSGLIERFGGGAVVGIGLLLGISVVLLIRAQQVWSRRQALGYSTYTADRLRSRLGRLALLGVALAIAAAGVYLWQSLRAPAVEEAAAEAAYPGSPVLQETRLVIPRLALEASLIEAPIVAEQWDISRLRDEVAHLEGTALPGQPGNIVLAGHITIPDAGWGPFRDLDQLKPGDRVFLETGNTTITYQVSEQLIVEPSAIWVAYPTEEDRLTLITCAGWSDILEDYAQRIVVVAERLP